MTKPNKGWLVLRALTEAERAQTPCDGYAIAASSVDGYQEGAVVITHPGHKMPACPEGWLCSVDWVAAVV